MTASADKKVCYDIKQLFDILPHRYPFLLVDRITEFEPGKRAKGYKNLTINENFFQGHFPDEPIMPGVLQIEALAQCAAPVLKSIDKYKDKKALFAGIDKARFKGIVRPGDRFDMEVELVKDRSSICIVHGSGYVDDKLVIDVTMMISLI